MFKLGSTTANLEGLTLTQAFASTVRKGEHKCPHECHPLTLTHVHVRSPWKPCILICSHLLLVFSISSRELRNSLNSHPATCVIHKESIPPSPKECNYRICANQTNLNLTKFILNTNSLYVSK